MLGEFMNLKRIASALVATVLVTAFAGAPATAAKPKPGVSAAMKAANKLKGMPPKLGGVHTDVVGTYHYQVVQQTIDDGLGLGHGGTQLAALESQHHAFVDATEGGHSLWEIAAQSLDQQQIVEVGYTNDAAVCGQSTSPCLFVYTWVHRVGQGYNGSNPGWIDNGGEAVNAGTALAVTAGGAVPTVFYQYRIERTPVSQPAWQTGGPGWQIAWKVSGTDHIVGYFPDTIWTGATPTVSFTKFNFIQVFGEEVAATSTYNNPCHDGGSGVYGTSTSPSAAAWNTAYSVANNASETNNPDAVAVIPSGDTPNAYRIYQNPADTDSIRWGGTGFNSAGTGAGTINAC